MTSLPSVRRNPFQRGGVRWWLAAVLVWAGIASAFGQPPPAAPADGVEHELFVPVDDIEAVFERLGEGVLLPRDYSSKLWESARQNLAEQPPSSLKASLVQAEYTARIVDRQLVAQATLTILQHHPGWETVLLPFPGWTIESAKLDDAPAPLSRDDQGRLLLFTGKAGRQVLTVEFSANLVAVGSDLVAGLGFPPAPAGRLKIDLPAGKHLSIDEAQVARPAAADQPASYVVAIGGKTTLSLRVSDRQAAQAAEALLFTRTTIAARVAPAEVTWQARADVHVYGKPVDRLQFQVPGTLDVVAVESTGLERWEIVAKEGEETALNLVYRQPFQETRSVTIRGVAPVSLEQPWQVPTLNLQQAASQLTYILVEHPTGIRLQTVETKGARRIQLEDAQKQGLNAGQPASQSEAFLAWEPEFSLKFAAYAKARELQASLATRLHVGAHDVELRTSVHVQTRFTPLFQLELGLPAEWTVTDVLSGGASLPWTTTPGEAGVHQVVVPLPTPLPVDGQLDVVLVARWAAGAVELEGDKPVQLPLPEVSLPQSTVTVGRYLISADNELEVTPEELSGLDPVPLSAGQTNAAGERVLSYEYQDTRFQGRLKIARKPAQVRATVIALHRLDPQVVSSHLEVRATIGGGGVPRLEISLPEAAGTDIRFRILQSPGELTQQTAAKPVLGERVWTLEFDRRIHGDLRFDVDLQAPRANLTTGKEAAAAIVLPRLHVVAAAIEEQYLAVEAGPDQQLAVTAVDAAGHALTEIDPPDMQMPAAYAPRERIIAAYHTAGAGAKITLQETRYERVPVPTAVCDRADLTSVLGDAGEFQHRASFAIRAVGVQSLRLELPPDSTLWATLLDGVPLEVRRLPQTGGATVHLLPWPAGRQDMATRTLDLFYRTSVPRLGESGKVAAEMPRLAVITGEGEKQAIEVLQRAWHVHLPETVAITRSEGDFQANSETELWRPNFMGWDLTLRWPTVSSLVGKLLGMGAILVLGGLVWLIRLSRLSTRWRARTALAACAVLILVLVVIASLILPRVENSRSAKSAAASHTPATSDLFGEEDERYGRVEGLRDDVRREGVKDDVVRHRFHSALDQPAPPAAPEAPAPAPAPVQSPPPPAAEPAAAADFVDMNANAGAMAGEAAPQAAEKDAEARMQPPQRAPEPKPSVVDQSGEAGARLSLVMNVEPPAGSHRVDFYSFASDLERPAPPTLAFRYANRTGMYPVCLAVMAGWVLLGWLFRDLPASRRMLLAMLGLIVPAALAPLVPVEVFPYLLGVTLGTVIVIAFWGLAAMVQNWPALVRRMRQPVFLLMLGATGAGLTGGTEAALGDDLQKPAEPARPAWVVPYEHVQDPFKADRVYLPLAEFRRLWNAAHPEELRVADPAAEGMVVEALYSATLAEAEADRQREVQVQARIVLYSLREGQIVLPLPLSNVAFTSATLDGQPAALIRRDTDKGPELALVLSGRGAHVLDAAFSLPATVTGPAGQFTLPVRPVPAGLLKFTLPEKGVRVRVQGASDVFRTAEDGDKTMAAIPVNAGGDVTVRWSPEQEREAAAAHVQAEMTSALDLDDTGVRFLAGVQLTASQGDISEIEFSVPGGWLVRQIRGDDVSGWGLAAGNEARTLKVFLRRKVSDRTVLFFDLYRPVNFGQQAQGVSLPEFVPQGVARETGRVAWYLSAPLQVDAPQFKGMSQIEVGQFAPLSGMALPEGTPQAVYRYTARPASLELRVARPKTVIRGTAQHAVSVGPHKMQVASRWQVNLSGSLQSDLAIRLPPKFLLNNFRSAEAADYFLEPGAGEEEGGGVLRVVLDRPRTGAVELVVDGVVPRDTGNLMPEVVVPALLGAADLHSDLAIWLHPLYTGQVRSQSGWKALPPNQLPAEVRGLRAAAIQFGFSSNSTSPDPVALTLEQAAARLSADSVTTIRVSEIDVRYEIDLIWSISHAAEDRFSFTVPQTWDGLLDFTLNPPELRIREINSESLGARGTRWTVVMEEPRSSILSLKAQVITPVPAARLPAMTIEFEQANAEKAFRPLERQHHYVVLVNQSPVQLDQAEPAAVESVGSEALPAAPPDVAQAAEILRIRNPQAAIGWKVRIPEHLKSLAASINLADLTLVVAHDGTWRGRADYRITNRARQFLAVQLPAGSALLSVMVAQRPNPPVPTRPVRGGTAAKDTWLIPLPKTAAGDLATEVQLFYVGRLPRPLPRGTAVWPVELDLPTPRIPAPADDAQFGIPVARTVWTVYFPDDLLVDRIKDGDRTNVTETDDSYERIRSDLNEAVELIQSYNSMNYMARNRAGNNLKQLKLNIQNAQAAPQKGINPEQGRELDELMQRVENEERAQLQVQTPQAEQQALRSQFRNEDLSQSDDVLQFKLPPSSQAGSGAEPGKKSAVEGKQKRAQLKDQAAAQAEVLNQMNDEAKSGKDNRFKSAEGEDLGRLGGNGPPATPPSGPAPMDPFGARVSGQPLGLMGPPGPGVGGPGGGGQPMAGAQAQMQGGGFGDRVPMDHRWAVAPGQQAGAPAGPPVASSTPWTAAGGLSLALEIPAAGRKLTLAKTGGEPRLAVRVITRDSVGAGLNGVWLVVWLALGAAFCLAVIGAPAARPRALDALCLLMALAGVMLLLLVASPSGWILFAAGWLGYLFRRVVHVH